MFMVLTFCALGMAIYQKFTGQVDKIVLGSALNFMFFAFLQNINRKFNTWRTGLTLSMKMKDSAN